MGKVNKISVSSGWNAGNKLERNHKFKRIHGYFLLLLGLNQIPGVKIKRSPGNLLL